MSNPIILVGLCGRARSGKDLCASALVQHRNCHRIALADPIRSALVDLGQPDGEILKELTPDHNYRRALQTLGTEARNHVNAPGLWVHLLLAKVYYLSRIHPVRRTRFVVPDIRFRLEEAMIRHQVDQWRGRFGILRLERSGDPIAESDHSSETEIDRVPFRASYRNTGTVEDLMAEACSVFDLIGGLS